MHIPIPEPTVSVPDLWNDNFINFGSVFYAVGTLRNNAHGYCLRISYLLIAVGVL